MEKWYKGEKIGSDSGNGILPLGVSFQRHSLGSLLGSLVFIFFNGKDLHEQPKVRALMLTDGRKGKAATATGTCLIFQSSTDWRTLKERQTDEQIEAQVTFFPGELTAELWGATVSVCPGNRARGSGHIQRMSL